MRASNPRRITSHRRGAAAVEAAFLLPFLVFLGIIAVDFARVFYYDLTLYSCARNGALYASGDILYSTNLPGIQAAALADATNLNPQPKVSSTTGVDLDGLPYVEVTVTGAFETIVSYPGVKHNTVIARTVRMRVAPTIPKQVPPVPRV
jgi:Flp pilus assembly protein TadG